MVYKLLQLITTYYKFTIYHSIEGDYSTFVRYCTGCEVYKRRHLFGVWRVEAKVGWEKIRDRANVGGWISSIIVGNVYGGSITFNMQNSTIAYSI